MKVRYVVTETGPNGDSEVLVKTFEDAEKLAEIGKEFWEEAVRINKVPERTYKIEKYIKYE